MTATRPRSNILASLIIILATAGVYWHLPQHEFTLWDDVENIPRNPNFNPPSLDGILAHWREPHRMLYVPVTYTVWGTLSFIAFDPETKESLSSVFAVANSVIHIGNALLVFALLARLFSATWPSVIGALLFALHPIQVETVAWISGTKDLLFAFFGLLYLHAYVSVVRDGQEPRARWFYSASIAFLILAMLSKPTAVVLPLIALVIDMFFLASGIRTSLARLWPHLILVVPCIIWSRQLQASGVEPYPAYWLRPLIAADALAMYLYKLVVPLNLALDYGRGPNVIFEKGWAYVTWIVPALLAVVLWIYRRRQPALVAAGMIFVIGVLPMLGLTPFRYQKNSTVADHYLYLSMLAAALTLAAIVRQFPQRGMVLSVIALVLLAVVSEHQMRTWRDNFTLFQHAVAVNPRSFSSHNNLATLFWKEKKFDDAERHLRLAVEAKPWSAMANDSLAALLARQGKVDQAIAQLTRPTRVDPDDENVYTAGRYFIGRALEDRGDTEAAAKYFMEVLRLDANHAQARQRLVGLSRSSTPTTTRGSGE